MIVGQDWASARRLLPHQPLPIHQTGRRQRKHSDEGPGLEWGAVYDTGDSHRFSEGSHLPWTSDVSRPGARRKVREAPEHGASNRFTFRARKRDDSLRRPYRGIWDEQSDQGAS